MPLQEYRRKRSANTTPEPFGRSNQGDLNAEGGIFVIQQHHARRMHFDFRLEMEGVLRSWAVPRGPSLNPADKRMAVMVEDHPIDYGNFEGIIPEGNYGAGSVIVWDRGTYTMIDPNEGDVVSAVHKGKLDLALHGFKLRGAFTLVRTGPRGVTRAQEKQQWLLIKKRDEYVEEDDVTVKHPASVLSGLSVDEITSASAASAQVIGKLTELSAKVVDEPLDKRQFPLMLAKPEDKPYEGDRWVYELKYDGVRALAIRDGEAVRLFARSGTDITARYPEVTLAFNTLPYDRFVMDGEIVALDDNGHPKFQLLQRRMHVQDSREVARLSFTIPVCRS